MVYHELPSVTFTQSGMLWYGIFVVSTVKGGQTTEPYCTILGTLPMQVHRRMVWYGNPRRPNLDAECQAERQWVPFLKSSV